MRPIDPVVAMMLALLRPAHAVYCTPADNLRISSWCGSSSVTVLTITGRFLRWDGEIIDIQERHVPTTTRTIATSAIILGEGWLLDLSIVSDGTPQLGHIFARAEIVRGNGTALTPLTVLAQGLLNAAQRLAFPGSPVRTTLDVPGVLRVFAGTNPAAAAEISEVVPTGARWRLLALSAAFVTDANVANRFPLLVLDDGANVYSETGVVSAIVASTTNRITFGNVGQSIAATPLATVGIIPSDIWLLAGHRIRTVTTNIQVADDYGAPTLLVEERLEAAA